MKKGFLSFAVAAIFLLAILSVGRLVSSRQPDLSYEEFRSSQVSELAIKRAFYLAVSEAAAQAQVAARGDPRAAVRAAVYARALEFERQLASQGYNVVFWCGEISEEGRRQASADMLLEKSAQAPAGALPLADCADSFEADTLGRKLHFFELGFSLYQPELGLARAAAFPAGYEVDF
jgi:hypothetical protein